MTEREIIETLAASFARSPAQKNALFTSDAEILELGGCRLAFTVDDYSAEDRLPDHDPELLGWNLVTATLSDLLAVGAEPRFMLNSLVVTPAMGQPHLRSLAKGMQAALTAAGAAMAGGDIGTGSAWRFTGVALGGFRTGQLPLSRVLPSGVEAGAVMVTGTFGDANLAAAIAGPPPRFELRLAESAALAAIPPPAPGSSPLACIDTSDGLAAALATLSVLNVGLRIEVDPNLVPRAPDVVSAAAAMRVPPEVFLLGSAGEYELLALVPESTAKAAAAGDVDADARDADADARDAAADAGDADADARDAAADARDADADARDADADARDAAVTGAFAALEEAGLRRIGTFAISTHPGVFFRRGDAFVALPELPDPRETPSFDDYCARLVELAQRVFGPGGRR